MNIAPIYQFEDVNSTGIDKVPANAIVIIKDSDGNGTPKQIIKKERGSFDNNATLADFLSSDSSIDFNASSASDASDSSLGLASVTEGGNTGWRLDSNASVHGDIGNNAIDFSFSDSSSTTRGATGEYSVAFGKNTTASGAYSVVSGAEAVVSGIWSNAFGLFINVSGYYSNAFGSNINVSGSYSAGFGNYTTVSGSYSVGFGSNNTVSGDYSAVFGRRVTTSGNYSIAFGADNTASGDYSQAGGSYVTSSNDYQFSFGKYNEDKDTSLFELGYGADKDNKANAFEVQKTGEVVAPMVDNTKIDAADAKVLITKEYLDIKTFTQEIDFDATSGTDAFAINGVYNKVRLFIDGVKVRSSEYTLSDDGTDTTITLNNTLSADAWVNIEY